MKDRFITFINSLSDGKGDLAELKELYTVATGEAPGNCKKAECYNKMVNAVRKYSYLNFEAVQPDYEGRKLVLKPGNHAFAPGETSVHNNDNTTDETLAWYIKVYPHVSKLLV